jgi:hypothetical protein
LRAEGFELDSDSYRHGQRSRRGVFAGNSSPGRGGLPRPARLSTRSAFLRPPRAARSAKYSSVRSADTFSAREAIFFTRPSWIYLA